MQPGQYQWQEETRQQRPHQHQRTARLGGGIGGRSGKDAAGLGAPADPQQHQHRQRAGDRQPGLILEQAGGYGAGQHAVAQGGEQRRRGRP